MNPHATIFFVCLLILTGLSIQAGALPATLMFGMAAAMIWRNCHE